MNGAPDPDYILARRVLLDALDALGSHRDSVILIGAQAVYFHTGRAEIAVAEYTTDADLALDPRALQPHPLLNDVLGTGGFRLGKNPGTWIGASNVEVDLLVWKWCFHVDHSPLRLCRDRRRKSHGHPGESHVSVYVER